MHIETFYDPATFTLTYVVSDEATRDAVIIDPVLDYDPLASQTSTKQVTQVVDYIERAQLKPHYVLETHAHADHLSASAFLKSAFPGVKVAIGERIREVQSSFKPVFDMPATFATDGSQFDVLLADAQVLAAGGLSVRTIATPGHTPACVSFLIGDAVFTGDALFMPDYGTGRCDCPRGSADELYTSVHDKLYVLPDKTRVFVGHDYQPGGRALRYETSIGASKESNIQLRASTGRAEFVERRTGRDQTLAAPRLLYPSVQVNIDAGHLPDEASNGIRYLRVPINLRGKTERDGRPRS
jgi:glyoxylase-like metal-dependent hydrolase (beta-lactamase superfamily II)